MFVTDDLSMAVAGGNIAIAGQVATFAHDGDVDLEDSQAMNGMAVDGKQELSLKRPLLCKIFDYFASELPPSPARRLPSALHLSPDGRLFNGNRSSESSSWGQSSL